MVRVIQAGREFDVPLDVFDTIKQFPELESAPQSIKNLARSVGVQVGGRKAIVRGITPTPRSVERAVATAAGGGVIVSQPVATGARGEIITRERIIRPKAVPTQPFTRVTRAAPTAPISREVIVTPTREMLQGSAIGLGRTETIERAFRSVTAPSRPTTEITTRAARERREAKELIELRKLSPAAATELEVRKAAFKLGEQAKAIGERVPFLKTGEFATRGDIERSFQIAGGFGASVATLVPKVTEAAPGIIGDPIGAAIKIIPAEQQRLEKIGRGEVVEAGALGGELAFAGAAGKVLGTAAKVTGRAIGKRIITPGKPEVRFATEALSKPAADVSEIASRVFVQAERPSFLGFVQRTEGVVRAGTKIPTKPTLPIRFPELGIETKPLTLAETTIFKPFEKVPIATGESFITPAQKVLGAEARSVGTVLRDLKGKPIARTLEGQLSRTITTQGERATAIATEGFTEKGVRITGTGVVREFRPPTTQIIQEGIPSIKLTQRIAPEIVQTTEQVGAALAEQAGQRLTPAPRVPQIRAPRVPPIAEPIMPTPAKVTPAQIHTRPFASLRQVEREDVTSIVTPKQFEEVARGQRPALRLKPRERLDRVERVGFVTMTGISQGQAEVTALRIATRAGVAQKQRPRQRVRQLERVATGFKTPTQARVAAPFSITTPTPTGFAFGAPFILPRERKKRRAVPAKGRLFREFINPIRRITGL